MSESADEMPITCNQCQKAITPSDQEIATHREHSGQAVGSKLPPRNDSVLILVLSRSPHPGLLYPTTFLYRTRHPLNQEVSGIYLE